MSTSSALPQSTNSFDVAILGGGLAGISLARQLQLRHPDLNLLVLDRRQEPLPEATAKVGESTVEISAFYLGHSLGLKDYFKNAHFKKLGFRFFTGDNRKPFAQRPEIGLSKFASFESYQMDRGVLENDLTSMVREGGAKVIRPAVVKQIEFSTENEDHAVSFKVRGEEESQRIKARWVVDATGRYSMIQRQLGLRVNPDEPFSAVWFRVKGRLDLADMVSQEDEEWHRRVPHKITYFSTNHVLGQGYWVWLIPLPTGYTSLGIVIDEKFHSFADVASPEKAMDWLAEKEPAIAQSLQAHSRQDFVRLRHYSMDSKQIFSHERWACVGEAAVFPDPYYSPGSNLIGFQNTALTHMIGLEQEGKLEASEVERLDHFILSLNRYYTRSIHDQYAYFHQEQVMSLSYLWDLVVGWGFLLPQMFHHTYISTSKAQLVRNITQPLSAMSAAVGRLLLDWSKVCKGSFTFTYMDYLEIPFVREIYQRNVNTEKSFPELVSDLRQNIR